MSEKQALIPRLRFPEFRDAGEWAKAGMSDLYGFYPINTLSRDKLNYTKGDVKNIHYGDIHTKFATLFDVANEVVPFINGTESIERIRAESYCIEGDLVFADASEDMEDVGKSIEIVNTCNEKIVSGLHTILARQLTNHLIIRFGGYLFKSGAIREQIKKEAQGAKVLGISSGRLSRIKICYPTDREEQQKIADCLSSLDELISAQAEKIDALKTHKKGLMQQLFPREGETVPPLRFPEFRGAGEWTIKALGELVDVIDGDRGVNYPKAEEFSLSGFCLFLSAKNVTKNGFKFTDTQFIEKSKDEALRNGKLKRNDVVLTTRGSVGQFAYFSEDISYENIRINSGMVILRVSSEEIATDYLYTFSKSAALTMHIENMAFGNAQQQLTVGGIKKIPICFPKIDEQQKIADCLASLDALITAQAEKVEALKTHKKGLMQKLFPSVESLV